MPSYLTTSDMATRLGVSLDTVRRWLRSGELKGTPFGRAGYRIDDADFQTFLHQRRRQPQELSPSSPERYSLSNAALEDLMNVVGQELRTPLTTTRAHSNRLVVFSSMCSNHPCQIMLAIRLPNFRACWRGLSDRLARKCDW
jgi:excisionase family DNA binding protein